MGSVGVKVKLPVTVFGTHLMGLGGKKRVAEKVVWRVPEEGALAQFWTQVAVPE